MRRFDYGAHGSAGTDHEGEAVARGAAAAHVVAGTVAERGKPGDAAEFGPLTVCLERLVERVSRCELIARDRQRGEHFGIVVLSVLVPEAGGGKHGSGSRGFAEQFQEEIFAGAHPVLRALEGFGLRLREPKEFGGRVAGVNDAAGARMLAAVVDALR